MKACKKNSQSLCNWHYCFLFNRVVRVSLELRVQWGPQDSKGQPELLDQRVKEEPKDYTDHLGQKATRLEKKMKFINVCNRSIHFFSQTNFIILIYFSNNPKHF